MDNTQKIVQGLQRNLPAELTVDAKEKLGIEIEVGWNPETHKWKVIKNHNGQKANLLPEEKQFINGWLQGYQVAIVVASTISAMEL